MSRATTALSIICFVASACAPSGASGDGQATDLIGQPPAGGQLTLLRHGNELVTRDYQGFVGYNPATGARTLLVACQQVCQRANWSPDGRWIAYVSTCD